MARIERLRVSKDYFISLDGVRYSVPWVYVGKKIEVRMTETEVQLFTLRGSPIASNRKLPVYLDDKYAYVFQREQYVSSKYEELAHKVADEKISYEEFILKLTENEKKERARRQEEVLLRMSNFPVIKAFEGFDFSFNPTIEKKVIEELRSLRFIEEHSNLLFLGPPGVGKTQRLRNYRKAQLLIIDEIGYLPLDKEEANLLFQVISTRYEKGSIIITSNKSIVEWGEYLADPVLASALLDRLLHHS